MSALDERAKRISEGLAAADKGRHELAVAEKRVQIELAQAHEETQKRIVDAERRASEIIEEAKQHAHAEAAGIVEGHATKRPLNLSACVMFCALTSLCWLSRVQKRSSSVKSMLMRMPTC